MMVKRKNAGHKRLDCVGKEKIEKKRRKEKKGKNIDHILFLDKTKNHSLKL